MPVVAFLYQFETINFDQDRTRNQFRILGQFQFLPQTRDQCLALLQTRHRIRPECVA